MKKEFTGPRSHKVEKHWFREPESKHKLSAVHPVANTVTELYMLHVNVTQIDYVQWLAGIWII